MPLESPPSRPSLVLIANDQEWSARSLESILAPQGYAVVRAYTGTQALERARTARPDLVILDAQLPDIHGLEVCQRLREDPRFGKLTPIVITTAGPSGRAQRLAAYQAGAWEFYGQPLDGEALLARLDTFLSAKHEADRLREVGMLESGSGHYTVRGLSHRIQEIASEAHRHGRPLACVALAVTETPVESSSGTGAEPGLGDLLRTHGRTSDAIAHLESNEFLVVAPDTAGEGAVTLVRRLGELWRDGRQEGRLQAGYSAVLDVRAAGGLLEPAELILRATAALRYALGHPDAPAAMSFDDLPAGSAVA